MKNIILLIALIFASLSQAATTKIPASMLAGNIPLSLLSGPPRLAGESFFAGTASCNWTRASTAIGAFGAVGACPGPTNVYGPVGTWASTDADLPRQSITSLPAGVYKAKFLFVGSVSTAAETGFAINDGTSTCEAVGSESGSVRGHVAVECYFYYASAGTRTYELYGGSTAGTVTVTNSATAPRVSVKFILEYWGAY